MKKIAFILFVLSISLVGYSQDSESALQKGNIMIDVGVAPFLDGSAFLGNTTGLSFLSVDGSTFLSVGADGGYFISDRQIIKAGLGYSDFDGSQFLSYRIGYKHYLNGTIPFQLDITGATNEDFDGFDNPDPLWLGIQGGYALFVNSTVAFEPTLRYDISLNSDFGDENLFQLNFNFVLFF